MNQLYQDIIDSTYICLTVGNKVKQFNNKLVNELLYWCDLNANATTHYNSKLYLAVVYNIIENNFDYFINNYKTWHSFISKIYLKGKYFIIKLKYANDSQNIDFDNFVASKINKINNMIVDKYIKEYGLEFIETEEMLEFITSILGDFVKEKKVQEAIKRSNELFVKTDSSNCFINFIETEPAINDEPMLIPESDCDSIAESDYDSTNTRPRRNVKKVNYTGMCK
jgi:hypothetical protein